MNPQENETPPEGPEFTKRELPTEFPSSATDEIPTLHPGAPHLQGRIPEVIGKFKIVKIIGEGGMGIVGLGTEIEGQGEHRQVAVKLLKRDIKGSAFEARVFDQECRSLSRFNHDNIARLIEYGHHQENLRLPYIVMEYVEHAIRITDYCSGLAKVTPKAPLPLGQRLELFLRGCAGIRHAHERNVIHRDISAKNVLVGLVDNKPVVKIIDFGISLHGETRRNVTEGATAGTPAYMSPEQLSGDAALVDQRSDVYALGILLCELMVGRRPYDFATTEEAKTALQTLESKGTKAVVPSRLAREMSTATKNGGGIPGLSPSFWQRLAKELRGDLDAIVAKATALNPDERYGSVAALVDDLEKHLSGHALTHARTPSWKARAIKFVHRNALGVAASVSIAILLLGLLAYGIHDYQKTLESNATISRQRDDLDKSNLNLRSQSERLWREQQRAYSSTLASFPVMLAQGKTTEARSVLAATRDSAEKGWEWNHLLAVSDQSEMVLGYSGQEFRWVGAVGSSICAVAADHSVWFWKSDNGQFLKANARHRFPVLASASEPSSCFTLDAAGYLMAWSPQSGEHKREIRLAFPNDLRPVGADDGILSAAFDPSCKRLLVRWRSGTASRLGLFSTSDGNLLSPPVPIESQSAVCWRENEAVQSLEMRTGSAELICRTWHVNAQNHSFVPLADSPLSPPEKFQNEAPLQIDSVGGREFIRFESGVVLARWDQGQIEAKSQLAIPVSAFAINSKGSGGVLGFKDGSIYRFECDDDDDIIIHAEGSESAIGKWCGHAGAINSLFLSGSDSSRLLSASADGSVRVWSLDRVQPSRLLSNHRALYTYWSGLTEAKRLESTIPLMDRFQSSTSSWCKVIENEGIKSVISISDAPPYILRSCCNELTIEPCNLPDNSAVPVFLSAGTATDLETAPRVVTAGASATGQFLAILRAHPTTGELDIVAGDLLASTPTFWTSQRYPFPPMEKLAVSPDGLWVAANRIHPTSEQEELVLWDFSLDPTQPVESVLTHPDAPAGTISAVEFSPTGDWLVIGNTSGRLLLWKKTSNEKPFAPAGSMRFEGSVRCLAISQENGGGRKIAVALADDAHTRGGPASLGYDIESRGLAFVDLTSNGPEGEPYIPDEPLEQKKLSLDLAWNGNGTRLASADSDGRLRIWSFRQDPGGLQLRDCRLLLEFDDSYRSDTAHPLREVSWSSDDRWLAASNAQDGCFIYHSGGDGAPHTQRLLQLEVDQARVRVSSPAELQYRGRNIRELIQPEAQTTVNAILGRIGSHPDQVTEWAWSALSRLSQLPMDQLSGTLAQDRQLYLTALIKDSRDVNDPKRKFAISLAHYRLGEFNKARAALSRSFAESSDVNLLLLALIDAQKGDTKRALQLREGVRQLQKDQQVAFLYTELEQLMESLKAPAPTSPEK